jgi:hypothetical protein
MIEPTLALQTAIRARLLDKPEVMALLYHDPARIRSGSTRPDKAPCVIMGDGQTVLHGNDYSSQSAAWVYIDLHVWTLDGGQEAAQQISGTVAAALSKYSLKIDGGYCDHFTVKSVRHHRDPNDYGHSTVSVEALIRWIV